MVLRNHRSISVSIFIFYSQTFFMYHRFVQLLLTMSSVNGSANDFLLGMINTLAAAAGNASLMSGTKLNKF